MPDCCFSEFSVKVKCPKYPAEQKVWVRKLVTETVSLVEVNGCDNCCGDRICQVCFDSVRNSLTPSRELP